METGPEAPQGAPSPEAPVAPQEPPSSQGPPSASQDAKPLLPLGPPPGYYKERNALQGAVNTGVNWFFWIAGLSVVNSVMVLLGVSISFVVGLGTTQVVDGIVAAVVRKSGEDAALVVRVIGFGLNLVIVGFFAGMGLLGRKRHRWAVILGMVVYVLDALIYIAVGDWLPVAFHALALWGLWNGLQSIGKLTELEQSLPAAADPQASVPAAGPVFQPARDETFPRHQ